MTLKVGICFIWQWFFLVLDVDAPPFLLQHGVKEASSFMHRVATVLVIGQLSIASYISFDIQLLAEAIPTKFILRFWEWIVASNDQVYVGCHCSKNYDFHRKCFFCYEDDTDVPHGTLEWKIYIICHWFSRLESVVRIWPTRTLLVQMEYEIFYLHERLSPSINSLDHIRDLDRM